MEEFDERAIRFRSEISTCYQLISGILPTLLPLGPVGSALLGHCNAN